MRNVNLQNIRIWAGCIIIVLLAGAAEAQMPHQVAVLVNGNSQNSKKAANVFARLHGVPGSNLIYLDLPEAIIKGRAECTPQQFKSLIYDPAQKTIEKRGLNDQILAWVYSVDFPIRVLTSDYARQQMSIMGMTFLRGEVPYVGDVEKGRVLSPLFAGPKSEGGAKYPSRAFEVFARQLGDKMPLPSMMLGYIGQNGNKMATVLRCLKDGALARQKPVSPRVLLVKTPDKNRSEPREWQFQQVKDEMVPRGASVAITTNEAPRQSRLSGVMVGAENIVPSQYGTFLPGAMAENLTSWSAEFQKPQTKCTEWLKGGATVTAGMVTEPYNLWVKFPHARFFAHYSAGCTAMESFYQSVFSPVQILLLGDPLAQIITLPVKINVVGLNDEITNDLEAGFVAEGVFPKGVNVQPVYSALLDGRQVKKIDDTSLIELPFDEMADGYHTVRVIVLSAIPVLPGGFKEFPIRINKKGRSIDVVHMEDRDPRLIVARAETKGKEKPKEVYLLWNGRELDREPYGEELIFDERVIGEGPHRLQAVAVYEDGMEVRSAPQDFSIIFNPEDL